jgi:hypothetical protein
MRFIPSLIDGGTESGVEQSSWAKGLDNSIVEFLSDAEGRDVGIVLGCGFGLVCLGGQHMRDQQNQQRCQRNPIHSSIALGWRHFSDFKLRTVWATVNGAPSAYVFHQEPKT